MYSHQNLTQQDLQQIAAQSEHSDERAQTIRKYYLKEYLFLERERLKIFPQISKALNIVAKPYRGRSWCRAVVPRFQNQPVSPQGSVLNKIGGRYNLGKINTQYFKTFPALYIARNETTARSEFYKQKLTKAQRPVNQNDLPNLKKCYVAQIDFELESIIDTTQAQCL